MKRWTHLSLAGLVLAVATGCVDAGGNSPLAPDLAPGLAANERVPTYSEERPGTFADMADEALWAHVAHSGNVAVVGLRKPGTNRGVYRGRILVDGESWSNAKQAVAAQRGVTVIFADTLLPTVKVKLDGIAALQAVRKLPFVSYVEPIRAIGETGFSPSSCGSSGGSLGSSSNSPDEWGSTGALYYLPSGDVYSDRHVAQGIDRAWLRGAAGSGTHIGLIDTGMHDLPYFTPTQWAAGESAGRYLMHGRANWGLLSGPSGDTPCSHGTLMAGAIAAPRDGQNVVGVAYKANMLEVHHGGGDVWGVGADDAQSAIRLTASTLQNKSGGKIVSMAFQSLNWWWQVSDELSYWYNNVPTLLFFASAGTDAPSWAGVVFPASHGDVLAVTCSDYPSGSLSSRCSQGGKVEFMAYQYVPSYQYNNGGISRIGGSSNADAVIVGIAAQVWSKYPAASRAQVVQRMRESGDLWPTPSNTVGNGNVNAHRATGGLTRLRLDAPVSVAPYSSFNVMAVHDGEGPTFSYSWNSGHTGSTYAPVGSTAGAVPTRAYQTSYTAGAAGTSTLVQVTVADPSDGTQKTVSKWVAAQAQDPYECVDPMQPCCDPTDPMCY